MSPTTTSVVQTTCSVLSRNTCNTPAATSQPHARSPRRLSPPQKGGPCALPSPTPRPRHTHTQPPASHTTSGPLGIATHICSPL
jgi:hypothetical protein